MFITKKQNALDKQTQTNDPDDEISLSGDSKLFERPPKLSIMGIDIECNLTMNDPSPTPDVGNRAKSCTMLDDLDQDDEEPKFVSFDHSSVDAV
jgi:hypothetical protein